MQKGGPEEAKVVNDRNATKRVSPEQDKRMVGANEDKNHHNGTWAVPVTRTSYSSFSFCNYEGSSARSSGASLVLPTDKT